MTDAVAHQGPGTPLASEIAPTTLSGGVDARALRAVPLLAMLSLASPAVGLLVEVVLAWRFGTGAAVDAFRASSLVAVFGTQVFIQTVMPNAIVPGYSALRVTRDDRFALFASLVSALFWLLPTIVMALWAWHEPLRISRILAPGLVPSALDASARMLPAFAFLLLATIIGGAMIGVLHVHRIFWAQPAQQLLFNLSLLVTIAFGARALGADAISTGLYLGATLMVLLAVALLWRAHVRISGAPARWSEVFRAGGRIAVTGLPSLAMAVLNLFNALLITRALSNAASGSLATWGYAWKLLQVATIVPTTVVVVLFPSMVERELDGNSEKGSEQVDRVYRSVLVVVMVLSAGLFAFRYELVSLLFHRGAFSTAEVQAVASLLVHLVVAAPLTVLLTLAVKLALSQGRVWTPVSGYIAYAVMAFFTLPMVGARFGLPGIAWATNLFTVMSVAILLTILRSRIGALRRLIGAGALTRYVLLWLGSAIPAALLLHLSAPAIRGTPATPPAIIGALLLFVATLWGAGRLLGIGEIPLLARHLMKRGLQLVAGVTRKG